MKRLLQPKNLCLALILYNLLSLAAMIPLVRSESFEVWIHVYPGALLFLGLYVFLLPRTAAGTMIDLLLMLGLSAAQLVGWVQANRDWRKGKKLIRIPALILLIGNVVNFFLMFMIGLELLLKGKFFYLNVALGIAVPILIMKTYKKWRE